MTTTIPPKLLLFKEKEFVVMHNIGAAFTFTQIYAINPNSLLIKYINNSRIHWGILGYEGEIDLRRINSISYISSYVANVATFCTETYDAITDESEMAQEFIYDLKQYIKEYSRPTTINGKIIGQKYETI